MAHVVVHCFMDGRDVPPKSGAGYLEELEEVAREPSDGTCTAEIGQHLRTLYYAMDRDNRWERVERAWRAVVAAEPRTDAAPVQVMSSSYAAGVTDEFVEPAADLRAGGAGRRCGRVLQLPPGPGARDRPAPWWTELFSGFDRGVWPQVSFVCLTEYDPEIPAPVAFAKEFPENVLADVLAPAGLRQYHIAETEKYAHVTFFLNGGREEPKAGEERALDPQPQGGDLRSQARDERAGSRAHAGRRHRRRRGRRVSS